MRDTVLVTGGAAIIGSELLEQEIVHNWTQAEA